jgi:hypothetical protein
MEFSVETNCYESRTFEGSLIPLDLNVFTVQSSSYLSAVSRINQYSFLPFTIKAYMGITCSLSMLYWPSWSFPVSGIVGFYTYELTHSLTHFKEQSPSWETNSHSTASKEAAFYGTQRFTTVFTRAYPWSLFWARHTQSTLPRTITTLHMMSCVRWTQYKFWSNLLWDLRFSW